MATLPDLGTNGLVNSIRKISGTTNPGYRKVASTASFIAGNVAILSTNGTTGEPELAVANASSTAAQIIGLFYCHKTTSFYRPVVMEAVTFGTSPNTATIGYLSHATLVGAAGTYIIVSSTGTTLNKDFTYTTDFTINYINGTITRVAGQAIGATATVYVTYYYTDPNLIGIDQTLGSGMAATLEDRGECATLAYDTGSATKYVLNGLLYSNATGYITATNGGGGSIGKITKVPTAEDPELHFKLSL